MQRRLLLSIAAAWGSRLVGPWSMRGRGRQQRCLELGILQQRGTSTTTMFHHCHILEPLIWQLITDRLVTRSFLWSRSLRSPAFF